jgi:Putative Actinobacterial Holin-X, holin superfamily III
MNEVTKSAPSVGDLLTSLVEKTGTLVRQEIHLASTEMGHKAKTAASNMGTIGVGGALAHAGVLSIMFALMLALGSFVPMWASALAIGLLAVGTGYALVRSGLSALRGLDPVPQRTLQTLNQDKAWMKEQFR